MRFVFNALYILLGIQLMIFITLKLVGSIDWQWFKVLIPLWILIVAGIIEFARSLRKYSALSKYKRVTGIGLFKLDVVFYIHGYGSNQHSRKFVNIKNHFKKKKVYDFMEWTPDSDFESLLSSANARLLRYHNPVIIGDSTGANFAYQLRERLAKRNRDCILILTSPLLNVDKRLRDVPFTENLVDALVKVDHPKDALVIATPEDEVLDQKWLFENEWENITLKKVDDGHRLKKFENYLKDIDNYIKLNYKP